MAGDRSPRSSSDRTVTATSPAKRGPESERQEVQDRWSPRRSSARSQSARRPSLVLQRTATRRTWWMFTLRDWDDDDEQDWWFASTAIPLFAATIGPLANVLSIAALVTYWRMCRVDGVSHEAASVCPYDSSQDTLGKELGGTSFPDPRWCYNMNAVSLALGFVGNFFLLCNFTNRIRYIIALPVTIVMWYAATALLIGITLSMDIYVPPVRPQQTYTQGFWYAVFAAILYLICALLLGINMLGYFLGHYPQHFSLTDSQRTLILQTMLFFVWLAGGGAVFSAVEGTYGEEGKFPGGWNYVNSLYFCDVTILTVGFGDLYPTSDAGRGLVFPYSVGGIIMLGLMVSSITKFVGELSSEKVVQRHVEKTRIRTIGRTVTTSTEFTDRDRTQLRDGERPVISAPFNPVDRAQAIRIADDNHPNQTSTTTPMRALRRATTLVTKPRKPKLILLREEKDRFDTMRKIQANTSKFKRWSALVASVSAFGTLWCVGAVVFWQCEKHVQGMTYFQGLYFCYVSLLTIGYGDLAPQSNPGRPFFVVWSLLAVPTMSILVNDLGDTVISKFKQGTFDLAEFTVLPKKGVWHSLLERNPWLLGWVTTFKDRHDAKHRLEDGFPAGPEPEIDPEPPTIDELACEKYSHQDLARNLGKAIQRTSKVAKNESWKRYSYEEWVEITQLIRFTAKRDDDGNDDEEGLIEWDWIGEDSPMMASVSEPEFVLDRLCESMNRYIRNLAADVAQRAESPAVRHRAPAGRETSDELNIRPRCHDEEERSGLSRASTSEVTRSNVAFDEKIE